MRIKRKTKIRFFSVRPDKIIQEYNGKNGVVGVGLITGFAYCGWTTERKEEAQSDQVGLRDRVVYEHVVCLSSMANLKLTLNHGKHNTQM